MPSNPCQPIVEMIAAKQQDILDLQDLLAEIPAGLKPTILADIKKEKAHLVQLKVALKSCQKAHAG